MSGTDANVNRFRDVAMWATPCRSCALHSTSSPHSSQLVEHREGSFDSFWVRVFAGTCRGLLCCPFATNGSFEDSATTAALSCVMANLAANRRAREAWWHASQSKLQDCNPSDRAAALAAQAIVLTGQSRILCSRMSHLRGKSLREQLLRSVRLLAISIPRNACAHPHPAHMIGHASR